MAPSINMNKLSPELQEAQRNYESSRKKQAGIMTPADPPICEEIWKGLSFRERVRAYYDVVTTAQGNDFPLLVYTYYVIKMSVYTFLFYYFLLEEGPVFTKNNAIRFLIYNIIQDATGCASTNGALGFRNGMPFVTWYNFVTPGSLCSPLIGNNSKRSVMLVGLYVAYILALARCLFFVDVIETLDIAYILLPLAIITPFDLTVMLASRGEHYIYMLFCCLFPNWLTGCQIVQFSLWTWAGIAKLGPWFAYCITQMVPNTPLLMWLDVIPLILNGAEPSDLGKLVATFGRLSECFMGLLCLIPATRYLGVFVTCGFHSFIISMMPFASVFEWNFCTIFFSLFLYGANDFQPTRDVTPASYLMFVFLFAVCFAIPLIGNLQPDKVPFLLAYRPYTGNWHFTWLIFPHREKVVKKLKQLKTLDSPVVEDDLKKIFGDKLAHYNKYYLTGTLLHYPNFRGILPVCEKLIEENGWTADEFHIQMQEEWVNCCLGWSLGNGWLVQKSVMEGMQDTCKFDKKQCYIIRVHALGLFERNVRWELTDLADIDNPRFYTATFEELAASGACDYQLKKED